MINEAPLHVSARAWAAGPIGRLVRAGDRLFARVPFHPFLFAAWAVLQLYVDNIGEIPAADVVIALLMVLAITATGFAILALVYRDARRAALLTAVAAVIVLGFTYLRSALATSVQVDPAPLLGVCTLAVVIVGLAAARTRALSPLTQAMNLASIAVLAMAVTPIIPFIGDTLRIPRGLALESLPPIGAPAAITGSPDGTGQRDIYFLVFDRYGSEEAFKTGFDLDNSEFVEWLRAKGFAVADASRANYARTTLSLGSSLSMTLLDDIAEVLGVGSVVYEPVLERARKSRAADFLQQRGYEYIYVGSWFDPTRESDIADRSYSPGAHVDFASALYEFSALRVAAEVLGLAEHFNVAHAAAAEYQLALLEDLVEEPGPKLIVAHVLLPHSPYVFLEDGTYAPGRATLASQLAYTNRRIRTLVEQLLEGPESERPIVIIQADEGPYPARYADSDGPFDWAAASDDEVITKFGILSAMYLPGPQGAEPLPPTISPVNTFREVLRRYFGADLPNLPDRSFGSSPMRPYELIDLTDRLPAPD